MPFEPFLPALTLDDLLNPTFALDAADTAGLLEIDATGPVTLTLARGSFECDEVDDVSISESH